VFRIGHAGCGKTKQLMYSSQVDQLIRDGQDFMFQKEDEANN
jgi:hypothetical protein